VEKIEFSLVIAQAVILGLSQLIYALQKSALNIEKRDRGVFAPQVTEALRLAAEARQEVYSLNTQKYESVRNDLLDCCKENAKLKAQISGLEESIHALSNKLASRDRADAMAIRRAKAATFEPESEDEQAPTAPRNLQEAITAGLAVPLGGPQPAAPQSTPVPPGFGRRIG